jgi:hypothetical protein
VYAGRDGNVWVSEPDGSGRYSSDQSWVASDTVMLTNGSATAWRIRRTARLAYRN